MIRGLNSGPTKEIVEFIALSLKWTSDEECYSVQIDQTIAIETEQSLHFMHDVTEQQEKVCILGTLAGGAAKLDIDPISIYLFPSLYHLYGLSFRCIKHKRHLHM